MIGSFFNKYKSNIKTHIFKTDIETKVDMILLMLLFNSNPKIKKWSIDLEDIDKVLIIKATKNLSKKDIIEEIKSKGFYCEKLD